MVFSAEIYFAKTLIPAGILISYCKGPFMTGFLAAIVLFFSRGLLPLFLWRHFTTMKIVGTFAIGAGCLIGLVDAATQLFHPGGAGPVSTTGMPSPCYFKSIRCRHFS
jgi:hypothetical protein